MIDDVTAALASFAGEPTSVPDDVLDCARRVLLRTLSAAASTAGDPDLRRLLSVPAHRGGTGPATVLWTGERRPAATAAWVNAAAVRHSHSDDAHFPSLSRPAGVVVPAAMALAELVGATGEALLTGICRGVEASIRVALALCPPHRNRTWDVTAFAGHVGAAVAGASILELGAGRTAHALGIAGTQATGFRVGQGTVAEALQSGQASRNAVEAALLAAGGFTGPGTIVGGRRGIARTATGWLAEGEILDGLGSRWRMLELTEVSGAVDLLGHPARVAIEAVAQRAPEPLERLAVWLHPLAASTVSTVAGDSPPHSGTARHILAAAASALHASASAQALGGRVTLSADPALDLGGARAVGEVRGEHISAAVRLGHQPALAGTRAAVARMAERMGHGTARAVERACLGLGRDGYELSDLVGQAVLAAGEPDAAFVGDTR